MVPINHYELYHIYVLFHLTKRTVFQTTNWVLKLSRTIIPDNLMNGLRELKPHIFCPFYIFSHNMNEEYEKHFLYHLHSMHKLKLLS